MKKIFIDTEATGSDTRKHDIIQISGIIEINGQVKEKFDMKCRPCEPANFDPESTDIHGYTLEDCMKWKKPEAVYKELCFIMSAYIDKFDKHDKFLFGGYKVDFDRKMIRSFAQKCGDKYGAGSWFYWYLLDVFQMSVIIMDVLNIQFPDLKLATLAKYYGVEIKAHDAMSDIEASRDLYYIMIKELQAAGVIAGGNRAEFTDLKNEIESKHGEKIDITDYHIPENLKEYVMRLELKLSNLVPAKGKAGEQWK